MNPPSPQTGTKICGSSYLKRVEKALTRSLLKMDDYTDDDYIQMTSFDIGGQTAKCRTKLPFYPQVEMEKEPVEREQIIDLQKYRSFGSSQQIRTNKGRDESHEPDLPSTTRKRESCLIESTSNSVRLSFLFKAQAKAASNSNSDPLEETILFQWMRFFMVQEQHPLMRKKSLEGYSVTFLVTNKHLTTYGLQRVKETILGFCSKVDKECSDIKLQVNAQARYVTSEFLKAFNNQVITES